MELTHQALASRLRAARAASGLTQEAVADALGISRPALAQIESGGRKVTGLELAHLARIYGRAITDFLADEFDPDAEPVLLRALTEARSDPAVRAAVGEAMSLVREIVALRDLLGLDRANPGLPTYRLPRLTSRWEAVELGTRLATMERHRLGLGPTPVPDMASLIESQGALVLEMELPEGVSGFTFWHENVAVLSIHASQPLVRQRFSLAHEYCHAVGGRGASESLLAPGEKATVSRYSAEADLGEMQANAFAAAFLAPEDGVRNYLASRGKGSPSRPVETVFAEGQDCPYPVAEGRLPPRSQDLGWLDIAQLSDHFGVSCECAVWRLFNLGLLQRNEKDRLLAMARRETERPLAEQSISGQVCIGHFTIGASGQFRLARQALHRLAVEALRREEISAGKFRELARKAGLDHSMIERTIAEVIQ